LKNCPAFCWNLKGTNSTCFGLSQLRFETERSNAERNLKCNAALSMFSHVLCGINLPTCCLCISFNLSREISQGTTRLSTESPTILPEKTQDRNVNFSCFFIDEMVVRRQLKGISLKVVPQARIKLACLHRDVGQWKWAMLSHRQDDLCIVHAPTDRFRSRKR